MMETITKTASFKMRLVDYVFGDEKEFGEKLQRFGRKHGISDGTKVSVEKTLHKSEVTFTLSWEAAENVVDEKQEQFDFSEASCQ